MSGAARFDRIVRNRLKVESTITNARAVLGLEGGFDELLWSFVGGSPKVNRWKTLSGVPAETTESKAMSKELKRFGFRFVGPTVCYAFMQAAGLVGPHGRLLPVRRIVPIGQLDGGVILNVWAIARSRRTSAGSMKGSWPCLRASTISAARPERVSRTFGARFVLSACA